MPSTLVRFDDFHVYGASAPEWRQCYRQISCGEMHSALLELHLGQTQLFRKTLSQRVQQQGCLPAGRICVAVLAQGAGATGPARVQGRAFGAQSLLMLRGGQDFVIHRPAGLTLQAVSFDAAAFDAFLAQQADVAALRAVIGRGLAEVPAAVLAQLHRVLSALPWNPAPLWPDPAVAAMPSMAEAVVMAAVVHALRAGGAVPRRGLSSHVLVSECQRLTLARVHAPPSIEELCTRLRASRRTLQDSFRTVAGTTPVDYLRALRLNLVREALHGTRSGEVDIGEIAVHAGFSQLSHFARRYRRLFGELPSQTLRAEALGRRGRVV